jgi:hypothetical protein
MVPIPANTTSVMIYAEGAAIYWNIGEASASSLSPGYAPQDTSRYIQPCNNLGTGLPVIGSGTAGVAHIEFWWD